MKVECNSNEEVNICNEIKRVWSHSRKMCIRVSNVTLRRLICRLNAGQGHDQIHSTFLKNASDKFLRHLAYFYNLCFVHCYLPPSLLKGTITPVLKDPKKIVTESSNYRQVMQSSCLPKIFELHVLDILSGKILLNPGFRTEVRIEKVRMAINRKIKFVCLKYVRIMYVGYKVRHIQKYVMEKYRNGKNS